MSCLWCYVLISHFNGFYVGYAILKKKSKLNSDSVDIVVCVLLPVAQSTFISGKKLTSILIGQNHNSANVPKRKKMHSILVKPF